MRETGAFRMASNTLNANGTSRTQIKSTSSGWLFKSKKRLGGGKNNLMNLRHKQLVSAGPTGRKLEIA